eukprot:55210-Lingulodinium_polyedra.AAC.1
MLSPPMVQSTGCKPLCLRGPATTCLLPSPPLSRRSTPGDRYPGCGRLWHGACGGGTTWLQSHCCPRRCGRPGGAGRGWARSTPGRSAGGQTRAPGPGCSP